MPSAIFDALAKPVSTFRSSLAKTVEQLRADLDEAACAEDANGCEDTTLGAFATGQIDFDRFGAFAARETVVVEPAATERVRQAYDVIQALLNRDAESFRISVEPGGSLAHAVIVALGNVGRAFGAARVAALSGSGLYRDDEHGTWLERYPYEAWNGRERGVAPPLVIEVGGADCHADGLARYLDGAQKIVLVVRGDEAPPAPLARLVTPGLFVMQTTKAEDLARLDGVAGPAIAALVPEGAATFVHDPEGGPHSWDRLTIAHVPETWPTSPFGSLGVFQLCEPLRQLQELGTRPVGALGGEAADGDGAAPDLPVEPTDKLAAWLLQQADLSGLE